jgi:hypothetical protein
VRPLTGYGNDLLNDVAVFVEKLNASSPVLEYPHYNALPALCIHELHRAESDASRRPIRADCANRTPKTR